MKTFNTNLFTDHCIYSWDDNDSGVLVIKKAAFTTAYEKDFAIDDKAMNVINKLGGIDNCDITLKDNTVIIKSGKVKVKTLIKDVPQPSINLDNLEHLSIRYNLKKPLIFTDIHNLKGGVLASVQVDTLGSMIATDSFWAFRHNNGEESGITINVSPAFIKLLENEDYEYSYNKTTITAESKEYKIIGRLLEGAYPNTKQFFAYKEIDPFATYDKSELINALDLAMLADSESDCIILSNNGIRLLSNNFTSDLKPTNNNDFEIGISVKKLRTLLKEYSEEKVAMYCDEEIGLSPIKLRDRNHNDTYILLPMRWQK